MPRNPEHDILFEPVKVGPKTTKNRFWQTPHCNSAGSERPGTQAAFRAMIHPESDDAPHWSARLWDEGDVISLRHVTDCIHAHGALGSVELYYAGLHSQSGESRAISRTPSQTPSEAIPLAGACEMDEDDIKAVIRMHVDAAIRARGRRLRHHREPALGLDDHEPVPAALLQQEDEPVRRLAREPRPLRARGSRRRPRRPSATTAPWAIATRSTPWTGRTASRSGRTASA